MGIAVALDVAAISALGWLIGFVVRLDGRQSDQRGTMKQELNETLDKLEQKIMRRIERLEDRLTRPGGRYQG